ncbi:MAG: NVEALA domain-containing protein [Prevotellaceae bacterium]|jgi:hypothetical protein|nr:NVEALA domain-containing protein [Prevotellaceae bacterium]
MNKKKIFGSLAILAIAAMAVFNINVNSRDKSLSDVALKNIEALAWEYISVIDCYTKCSPNSNWYCTITLYYNDIVVQSITCTGFKPGLFGYY